MKRKIDLLYMIGELKFHSRNLWLGESGFPKIYIPLSMILVPFVAVIIYQLIK